MSRSEMTLLILGHLILYFSLAISHLYYKPMWLWSWEGLFCWRNFWKAEAKIEGFWSPWWPSTAAALIQIKAYEGQFKNRGLERAIYIPICWALASASLITADKVPLCSCSESTTVMSASVKDFLPRYRGRSLFPARKRFVPGMNPHTSNAATK